ncbi:MAG: hypothetical protein ACI8Z7_000292 [Candidatus Nanohaloarchaea archaeon]
MGERYLKTAVPGFLGTVSLILLIGMFISTASASNTVYVGPHQVEPSSGQETSPGISALSSQTAAEKRMIVRFEEVPDSGERNKIERKTGIEFLSYASNRAWVVKATEDQISGLEELKVDFTADYRQEYKLGEQMSEEGLLERSVNGDGTASISVEFFSDVSEERQKEIIEKHGKTTGKSVFGNNWNAKVPTDSYLEITQEEEVKRIRNKRSEAQPLNDRAREVISADRLYDPPFDLKGDGFTASMWDTGWAGNHTDLSSKTYIGDRDECVKCEVQSHATHVAGTMLGSGNINSNLRGVAPEASLISHEVDDLTAYPLNMNRSINENNSILSQNSYGKKIVNRSEMGDYDQLSNLFDNLVRTSENIPRTTVVFSAGNERNEGWGIDYNTTTSWGSTAKNTIVVGAVDDNRDMTSYSSWGPTDDGRIKPDLVADGGGATGLVESTVPNGSSQHPYGGKGGTSMASPAVSGAIILLNEQFNETHDHLPAPATTKGILIQTAEDLEAEGPDYKTGWGLVNATEAVKYVRNMDDEMIRREYINSTGEKKSYTYEVPESAEDISFTLVWSDYPANPGSEDTLKNDLDLNVTDPEGERKYPWTLEGGSDPDAPASRDSEDHTNNVEQVYVENASAGSYQVQVEGEEVPYNQSFSLIGTSATITPEIRIHEPEGLLKEAWLNVSADENVTNWKYSLNGEPNETFTPNTTLEDAEGGFNTVNVWALAESDVWVNKSGNFTRDIFPPEINLESPKNISYQRTVFPVNASIKDNLTNVTQKNYSLKKEGSLQETGSLNSTINSSSYPDGNYSLELNATDYFGNTNTSEIELGFDNTAPNITVNRTELRYLGGEAFINGSGSDSLSGLEKIEYRWEKDGENLTDWRNVNSTFNTETLQEEEYNLSFRAFDTAGNINSSISVESSVDNTPPNATKKLNLTDSNLSRIRYLENGKAVNLTEIGLNWSKAGNKQLSDSISGIESYRLESREEEFSNSTGGFENLTGWETFETIENPFQGENRSSVTLQQDKKYRLSLVAVDRAGNENRSNTYSLSVDRSEPVKLENTENPVGWTNSQQSLLNSTFTDISEVRSANFTVNLSSGDQKLSTDISREENRTYRATANQTVGLESLEYYSVNVEAEDVFGYRNSTIQWSFRTDFNEPEVEITGFKDGESVEFGRWYKDSLDVELKCSEPEDESGHSRSSVNIGNDEKASSGDETRNFTLKEEGENDYRFECQDTAGNTGEKIQQIRIDSEKPEIDSFSISNNSEIQADEEIEAELEGESEGSGINPESSDIKLIGEDESYELTNSSFTVDADLNGGEEYGIQGNLTDFVRHSNSFYYSFKVEEVEEEEENSNGGDSGGGGGGGFAPASQDETEEEEDQEGENDEQTDEEVDSDETENSDDTEGTGENTTRNSTEDNIEVENVTAEVEGSELTADIQINNPGQPQTYMLNITVNGENYTEQITAGTGRTSRTVSLPLADSESYTLNVNGERTEVAGKDSSNTALTMVTAILLVLIGGVAYIGFFRKSSEAVQSNGEAGEGGKGDGDIIDRHVNEVKDDE